MSIHARRGTPSEIELLRSRRPSMSRLTSSTRNGLPVAANNESTTCSAVSRRRAGATAKGLGSRNSASASRWYACEFRIKRMTCLVW